MKKSSPASVKRSAKKESSPLISEISAIEVPRSDVRFSDDELKRRELFQSVKKNHQLTETEFLYGAGKLPVWEPGWLLIQGARQNNLKSIDVPIPLSAFTAVTGVSGSGKSSLIEEILSRELSRVLNRSQARPGAFDRILGIEHLNKVIEVDQQPLGLTPASNPATYTGLFDLIRSLFAHLPESKLRGWQPRRFSFNVPGGRCEKCEGAGQLKIEMHFLADVWITCDACGGKRYDSQTLEVTYKGKSIADVLEMSCGEALKFFSSVPRIRRILKILCDVGLDYIALGQPATMLSGGEAQRVKLAAELARPDTGRTLYILDEPTTGLHFEDLQKLLNVLQRLVDLGNTVVVIEHNLDIIKSVDWVIDLGPEAGLDGGQLVFAGTPEELAAYGRTRQSLPPAKRKGMLRSWTAEALIPVLESDPYQERPLYDPSADILPAEETFGEKADSEPDVPMPWETDGRTWHTQSRRNCNGDPCRWDGQILAEVVDKIEDSGQFSPTNWSSRSHVETRARQEAFGWFFQAGTGEEWLLKLKFRIPKNSFEKEKLLKDLWLKPLNEIDEIPLYGTQPRVQIESIGPWYEVEMRPYGYDEFNRPEIWAFLDKAIEEFARSSVSETKLPSWEVDGEQWHFDANSFYGGNGPLCWSKILLTRLTDLIRRIGSGAREVWTKKLSVPFYRPDDSEVLWCQLYTKDAASLILQIDIAKGCVTPVQITSVGTVSEIDFSNDRFNSIYLKFVTEKDLDEDKVEELLRLSLENPY